MKHTKLILFIVIFLSLFQVSAPRCADARELVKVGYFQNEPLIFKNIKGRPEGLYVDLINKIAEKENWDIEYVFGNWSESLQRLKNNEIDLMTSIAPTKSRKKEMVFSKESILTTWGQVYSKTEKSIEDILDLEGQSVAILKNGINGTNFKKLIEAFGIKCRLIEVESYEVAAQYVDDDLAAGCVINNIHGRLLETKYDLKETPIMFNPFKLVFATSNTSSKTHLLNTIDELIRNWKKDGESFYNKRVSYWYGERPAAQIIIPEWISYSLAAAIAFLFLAFVWIRSLSVQIQKREKAQQKLADSQQRLADIIEFLPDPTWVIDIEGKTIAWNKAIEELTGILKKDILGKGDYEYSVPFYGSKRPLLIDLAINRDKIWEKEYLDLEKEGDTLTGTLTYIPGKAKSKRHLVGTAGRLYDSKGLVVGAIEILRDMTEEKKLEDEREQLIKELQDAASQIQTLSGLLPICASCKKIRDDKGYWNNLETYIEKHSDASFSHGICPECSDKLYGDQEWYRKKKRKQARETDNE